MKIVEKSRMLIVQACMLIVLVFTGIMYIDNTTGTFILIALIINITSCMLEFFITTVLIILLVILLKLFIIQILFDRKKTSTIHNTSSAVSGIISTMNTHILLLYD